MRLGVDLATWLSQVRVLTGRLAARIRRRSPLRRGNCMSRILRRCAGPCPSESTPAVSARAILTRRRNALVVAARRGEPDGSCAWSRRCGAARWPQWPPSVLVLAERWDVRSSGLSVVAHARCAVRPTTPTATPPLQRGLDRLHVVRARARARDQGQCRAAECAGVPP